MALPGNCQGDGTVENDNKLIILFSRYAINGIDLSLPQH